MGQTLIIKGANFKPLNLGNLSLAETFILNAGITNETHKTAIKTFYDAFKAAGFYSKFQVARLYCGATALADSLNLVDPQIGSSHYQSTFQNDNASYHTIAGWSPNNAALHLGKSNFPVSGNVNNLHFHAMNTTSEAPATSGVFKHLLGSNANAAGVNDFTLLLARNYGGRTRAQAGGFNTKTLMYAPMGYDLTKTGLLSFSRQTAGLQKLYDGGAMIATLTANDPWITSGATQLIEGNIDTVTSGITDCKLRFLGFGFSTWTDADESALNAMLVAFNAAIV